MQKFYIKPDNNTYTKIIKGLNEYIKLIKCQRYITECCKII